MCGYSCDSLNCRDTSRDTWVIRIDDAGDVIWSQNYPVGGVNDEPTGDDALFETAFAEPESYEVCALVRDGCEADTICWTVDAFEPEGVAGQVDPHFPTELTLCPPSPNPFNSTAVIEYFLPADADVTIRLIDLSGRTVSTLADSRMWGGWHRCALSAENISVGIYFIRLQSGGITVSQKLVLVE